MPRKPKNPPPRPDDLLTTEEVGELLGVKAQTVRAYGSRPESGMPPPDKRFGLSPAWKRSTIEAWLQSRPGRGTRPAKADA